MPLFHCIHCGQSIDAGEEWLGRDVACPACNRVIQVPHLGSEAPTAALVEVDATPVESPPPVRKQRVPYEPAPEDPDAPKSMGGRVILATIISAALALFGATRSSSFAWTGWSPMMFYPWLGFFAGLTGVGLIVGLFAGGVSKLMGKPFLASFQRWYAMGAICMGTLSTVGSFILADAQAEAARKNALLIQSSSTVPAAPGQLDRPLLRKAGLALYNALADETDRFNRHCKSANVTQVLEPAAMAQPQALGNAAKKVTEARKLAEECRETVVKLLANATTRFDTPDVSPEQKTLAKEALQKALDRSTPLLTEYWDEQVKSMVLLQELTGIISTKPWQPVQTSFGFANPDDLKAYEAKMAELRKCVGNEDALREKAHESLRLAVILPGEK